MFQPKKHRPEVCLGLDISSSAITLIQISWDAVGPVIEAYARQSLGADLLEGPAIKEPELIAACIQQMHQHFTSKKAIVALPDTAVIIKTLSLPATLKTYELEALVRLEAQLSIPLSLAALAIDYEIIPEPESNSMQVLMVAGAMDLVQQRLDILHRAKLSPICVEVESFAVARALQSIQASRSCLALFEVATYTVRFFVVVNYRVVYAKQHPRKKENHLPEEPWSAILSRLLHLFYASSDHGLTEIYLAGEIEPDLLQAIRQLGIPSCVLPPWLGLNCAPSVRHLKADSQSSQSLLACGLALRGASSHDYY